MHFTLVCGVASKLFGPYTGDGVGNAGIGAPS
jgi:hypothetical protein